MSEGIDNNYNHGTQKVALGDNAQLDAFGRLRVSQINQLFDAKHLTNKLPILFDERIGGTATSVHNPTTASVNMTVSTNGDYSIRQTRMRFNYQTGKSHLIKGTFVNLAPEPGVIKRFGYFSSAETNNYNDTLDGIFLQSDDNGISINVYRSGTLIEQVYQVDFNIDKLDYDYPTELRENRSKVKIDWTKAQIAAMDFQWLGVGRVRWELNVNGDNIIFHETLNANNIEDVYMSSPNQPIRYEIRSVGGAGSFKQICSSVETEGAVNENGYNYSVDGGSQTAASSNNNYVSIAFKLNNKSTVVKFPSFSFVGTTNDDYIVSYILNPTISAALTYNQLEQSGIDVAIGTTQTVTGGLVLGRQILKSSTAVQFSLDQAIRLGFDLDNVSDVVVLAVQPLSNGLNYRTIVNIKELI